MKVSRRLPWRGPPLALQIMALLLGGLVVAQLVTLFLTLLLPPAPTPQYGLDDIAAALKGGDGEARRTDGLQRIVQAGPPDIAGAGWLVSERSRLELARLVGAPEARVSLAFYTPLPFAGTARAQSVAMADDGPVRPLAGTAAAMSPVGLLRYAQFSPPPGNAMSPAGGMGQNAPPPPPRDSFPPGGFGDRSGVRGRGRALPGLPASALGTGGRTGPLISTQVPAVSGMATLPGDGGAAVPPVLRGTTPGTTSGAPRSADLAPAISTAETLASPGFAGGRFEPPPAGAGGLPRATLPGRSILAPAAAPVVTRAPPAVLLPQPLPQSQPPPSPVSRGTLPEVSPSAIVPALPSLAIPAPLLPGTISPPGSMSDRLPPATPAGPPIVVTPTQRSLFGLSQAPFVEGDFVAALQIADGRWVVVQPAPEALPNSWQRRVLLWFLIASALVAPFGWLFARRLVKPLERFAGAAEQLGREPGAVIGPLDGPAEIGRAAHAFNLMQNRLRSFVDDRTAMVGAISHDLRTPLTRMRFRIEDVPDDVRDGLLEEVDDMEAMITQVIEFIRDASTPGARERLDLSTIMDEVVEDARLVGRDVSVDRFEPTTVEVDVLGMRRVLDNLLENAIKYGVRARVRVRTDADSAVAEIIDDGPGLPDDEIERVFEPFYRTDEARASDKTGSGLGLAVCRSIARAHGGDVRLRRSGEGFLAEVRVPLAFGAERSFVG